MKRFYLLGAFILLSNTFYCPVVSAKSERLADYVTAISKTDTTNMATDDPDHNPRYIGIDPNNYVSFNGELWRIIGVFDGHVKLMRSASLGNYSWDSSSSDINKGLGVNSWTQADLMNELNGDYLNTELTENTLWYGHINNSKKATFDHTKVIKADAQELVEDYTWYLGSANVDENGEFSTEFINFTASSLYRNERNSKNTVINPGSVESNDGLTREDTWTGKIGLPYPSDVLYSAGSDEIITKEQCQSTGQWRANNEYFECNNTSWMSKIAGWFISSFADDGRNFYAFYWLGKTDGNVAAWTSKATPTLYLKKNVVLLSGTGSKEDPYEIKLEERTVDEPEIDSESDAPGVPDTGVEVDKSFAAANTSVLVGVFVGGVAGFIASKKKIKELLNR